MAQVADVSGPPLARKPLIYLAIPVRGSAMAVEDVEWLIETLRTHGSVLTEHLQKPEDQRLRHSDDHIFRRQMQWLHDSTHVVADISMPSHGVGYEVAIASRLAKPTLAVRAAASERRTSAMIGGDPGILVLDYRTRDELRRALDSFLRGETG